MPYRVEYEEVSPGRAKRSGPGKGGWALLCLLLMFLLANLLWPRGRQLMWKALIPGDTAVTVSAFEELTEDLRTGEALQTALEDFCRRVLGEDELAAP